MTDIAGLESEITAAIGAAKDEAALEALRVSALGKSGSVSALLKTLGSMTPDERKIQGPAINGLKDRVGAAIACGWILCPLRVRFTGLRWWRRWRVYSLE